MDSDVQTFSQALRDQVAEAMTNIEQNHPTDRNRGGGAAPAAQPAPEPRLADRQVPQTPDPRVEKLIQQAQQVRAEREAFKREQDQQRADMEELRQLRDLKARAKEDPIAWAEAGGYKAPDEFASELLSKGQFTPEKRKIMEQEKMIRDLQGRQQAFEDHQRKQHENLMYSQTKAALENYANQKGEDYDLVKRTGSYDLVMQKFHDHYQKTALLGTPEELPWDQCFQQAEDELLTKYEPVLESPKIRSRYGAAVPKEAEAPTASSPAVATRSSGSINPKNRGNSTAPQMSEEDSLKQAGNYLFRQFRA